MNSENEFLNSRIIKRLLNTAYWNFKTSYPTEEPMWRISCYPKQKHQGPMVSRADLSTNWRVTKKDNVSTTIETMPILPIKKKTITSKTKVQYKESSVSKTIFGHNFVRVIKDDPIIIKNEEIITEELITTKSEEIMDVNKDDIIISFDRRGPVEHQIVVLKDDDTDEVKRVAVFGDEKEFKIDLKTYNHIKLIENKKTQIVEKIESIKKMMAEFKDLITEVKSKVVSGAKDFDKNLEDQKKKFVILQNELNEEEIKCQQHIVKSIGKSFSSKEIIEKYIDLQKKLNDCKSMVIKSLKKNVFDEKFNELLKEKGFIMSIPEIINHIIETLQCDEDDCEYGSDDD